MSSPSTKALDLRSFWVALGPPRKTLNYRKKEVIFSQGDVSDSMFYIENGSVKLTVVTKEGKEAVISVTDGGHFFGESCISLDRSTRFHSAVALTNVQLVKIDRGSITQLLRSPGEISLNFIGLLLRSNAEIQQDLASRLVDSSEESLARVVSSLVQFRDKQSSAALPKINQQTLAEMVGISRQHVNVLLKRMKKALPNPGTS